MQFRWMCSGGEAETAVEAATAALAAEEAAAAVAAVHPWALAAAATVWLAFDCLPPPDEIQEILSGNCAAWLPTVDAEVSRLQNARRRLQADGAADRWATGPPLVLPIVATFKDLGVAQGFDKLAQELQAERAKTAFSRLEFRVPFGGGDHPPGL